MNKSIFKPKDSFDVIHTKTTRLIYYNGSFIISRNPEIINTKIMYKITWKN